MTYTKRSVILLSSMTFWRFLWFSMAVGTMNFIQKSFSFIFLHMVGPGQT